jgi:hypothetical protein
MDATAVNLDKIFFRSDKHRSDLSVLFSGLRPLAYSTITVGNESFLSENGVRFHCRLQALRLLFMILAG